MSETIHKKRPDWLKIKLKTDGHFSAVRELMTTQKLNTVCEEARCPNIYECWSRKTATIMILGDTCTRACGFCSVKTGKPPVYDKMEPFRTAQAVKNMALEHVVITSVDRDDLKNDFGAIVWAETISQIHQHVPNCTVEVLTPDFQGHIPSLEKVFNARPEIFSHNVECVERISTSVRTQSNWQRTKSVLKKSVKFGLLTKTGLMVGLGETDDEVLFTMREMADIGVEIFNVGQYLQPTKKHLPVDRFVHPDLFEMYKEKGLEMGFKVVESGPLVRSSYHADEQAKMYGVESSHV
jgi:lipoic acid synthetase